MTWDKGNLGFLIESETTQQTTKMGENFISMFKGLMDKSSHRPGFTLWPEIGPILIELLKNGPFAIQIKKFQPNYIKFVGRVGHSAHVQV